MTTMTITTPVVAIICDSSGIGGCQIGMPYYTMVCLSSPTAMSWDAVKTTTTAYVAYMVVASEGMLLK